MGMVIKKMYRKARRNVCRAIYYADWCPVDNRKNYKQIAQNALAMIALVFACVAILSALFIIF